MFDISKRLALGALLSVPGLGAVAIPMDSAGAAPPSSPIPKNHCITEKLSNQQLAAGTVSTLTCYATFAESMAAIGVRVPKGTQPVGLSVQAAFATQLLAVHFDGYNASGASLGVWGNDCDGGGINVPAEWDNRISSTRNNACSTVKHWADANFTGAEQTTSGGYGVFNNMNSYLNNQVSSIKYFGPVN